MDVNIRKDGFFMGVNYWASHAGIYMWRDWKPEIVEQDFQKLASIGVKVLRVFPLWCDFQPITALYEYAGIFKEVAYGDEFLDPRTEAGKAGVSVCMMERFEYMVDLAEKYGFRLIVSLLTGWMSGRLFVPEALRGKNAIRDPFCIRWEIRFVKYFVKYFRNKKNIIAWEQGNECNCLALVESAEEAFVWSNSINDAIRSQDSTRPVISGMHSLATGDCWNIKDQAEICDVLTIHPYILFTENCMLDRMVSPRAILHSPAEQTLYEDIGGKDCLVEEIGTLGPFMGCEEKAADFLRANLFNAWAHGSHGMIWWTGFDQGDLSYAPYDWAAVERELGLFCTDGREKPLVQTLREFDSFLREIPYKMLPKRNRHAVCMLSPDDWNSAYGAFMLAKRAGIELKFADCGNPVEDANLYILPGGGVLEYRKRIFNELLKKVEVGATLLITDGKTRIVPFESVIGCKSYGRYQDEEVSFALDGEELRIKREFAIDLVPDGAEVILRDSSGKPLLTKNQYGKGNVLFFNAPLEQYYAKTPAIASSDLGYEKIYAYIARIAMVNEVVKKNNPHIAITVHNVDAKRKVVVAMNNTEQEIQDVLSFQGVVLAQVYRGSRNEDGKIVIPAADAVVFEIKIK